MNSNLKFRLAVIMAAAWVIGALSTIGVVIVSSKEETSQPWLPPVVVLVALPIAFMWGPMARLVAERKNLDPRKYSSFGAVGLIRAALAEPAAPGLRAVRCPHCHTDQNIARAQSTFGCRRCGLISSAPRVKGRAYAG